MVQEIGVLTQKHDQLTTKTTEQMVEIDRLTREKKSIEEKLSTATARLALIEEGKGLDAIDEKQLAVFHSEMMASAQRVMKYLVWYDLKRNPLMFEPARLAQINKADADRFTALAHEKLLVSKSLEESNALVASLNDQKQQLSVEHEQALTKINDLNAQLIRTTEEKDSKADGTCAACGVVW